MDGNPTKVTGWKSNHFVGTKLTGWKSNHLVGNPTNNKNLKKSKALDFAHASPKV